MEKEKEKPTAPGRTKSSLIEKLRYLCSFAATSFTADNDYRIQKDSFHYWLLFRNDGQEYSSLDDVGRTR
jgi:hypothetical protein